MLPALPPSQVGVTGAEEVPSVPTDVKVYGIASPAFTSVAPVGAVMPNTIISLAYVTSPSGASSPSASGAPSSTTSVSGWMPSVSYTCWNPTNFDGRLPGGGGAAWNQGAANPGQPVDVHPAGCSELVPSPQSRFTECVAPATS